MSTGSTTDILAGETAGRQWREVVALLEPRQGREQAITIAEIQAAIGARCRREVEHLLESRFQDFPWPVVAGAHGYFRPTEAADLNQYRASLRSRAIKDFLRARALTRAALAHGFRFEGRRFVGAPRQQELQLA